MNRSEVQRREVDVERVEFRERRHEDVERAVHRCLRHRAGHVRVVKRQLTIIHVPIREHAARPAHGAGERALPIHRKRTAGEGAQQVESIGDNCASTFVTAARKAHDERHRAGEVRLCERSG